jgi:hypothetical protein
MIMYFTPNVEHFSNELLIYNYFDPLPVLFIAYTLMNTFIRIAELSW